MYQTLLNKVDFIERDLLPSTHKLGDSEDFEQQVFMKLTQDQISTVLLNGVLENIIHRKDQTATQSMVHLLNRKGIDI